MTRKQTHIRFCWGGIKDQRGSLLLSALLITFVILTLGSALLLLTLSERRIAERSRRLTTAFQIAEAGIEQALYDLRQDFVNDSTPAWDDGDINGYAIGPNTSNFYSIPYSSTSVNGGSFAVQLKNIPGQDDVWIESTGTLGDITQTIQVYASIKNLTPWDNAIFAGTGASGTMINGNVDIRGSVHILGSGLTSTDYAVDLGGTSELIGNNYVGVPAALTAKVPALDTINFNGEIVDTLHAELRVKNGIVGLSGSASVGDVDATGNAYKETVDGSFVTHGFGGSQGTGNVNSDNGWSNGYDLGDAVSFPSLSDPYGGYATYQAYLQANALVLTNELNSLDPNSSFTYSNGNGSIAMDGSGNMTISGIVYVDGGNDLTMSKAGSDTTITYSGTGSILVTGDAQIDVNLITPGNNSYPNNVIGIMTPNTIGMNEAGIDVMGLFYAENTIAIAKQTNIMGTLVGNYFDMGTNVPSVFQVPSTVSTLPPGMIAGGAAWVMRIVSWKKL